MNGASNVDLKKNVFICFEFKIAKIRGQCPAFMRADPKVQKASWLDYLFARLGSVRIKSAHKMLVKTAPGDSDRPWVHKEEKLIIGKLNQPVRNWIKKIVSQHDRICLQLKVAQFGRLWVRVLSHPNYFISIYIDFCMISHEDCIRDVKIIRWINFVSLSTTFNVSNNFWGGSVIA